MTPDRRERLDEVFGAALDLPHAERSAFVREQCADDAELCTEALSLLASLASAGGFLESTAAERLVDAHAGHAFRLEPGATVGRYVVERQLGEGGSGAVYLARQDEPRRPVALKFLRARLLSGPALARFRQEAEILARLDHPGVAHVYAAGTFEVDGVRVPYYSLEYVRDGQRITAYADRRGLRAAQRIDLVAQVCDAVHHGHQNGVVHLDLKPANVLVGASGRPKVIDFGIALSAGSPGDDDSGLAGTLSYMAPEQADDVRHAVDLRADVFALAVLLHELLTGALPLDVQGDDVDRALGRVASEPRLLAPARLDADLVAILSRGLALRREDRYASAAALAEDLRRHLRNEPVSVRRQTLGYQGAKFARRRPLAFGALVTVVLVLAVATAVSSWLAVDRAHRQHAAERSAYAADLAAVQSSLREADAGAARIRLERVPPALRGWEWRHLRSRVDDSTRTFTWPVQRLRCGAVSPDGGLAVAAGAVGAAMRLRAWELDTGTVRFTADAPAERTITALGFPRAEFFVVGHDDGSLDLRSAAGGAVLHTWAGHARHVTCMASDGNGRRLVTGSRDGTAHVWDLATGTRLLELPPHTDRVVALAIAANGERIAIGSRDGAVRLVDAATGRVVHTLEGHEQSVEGVCFTADDTRLVSVSRDRTLRVWDARAGGRALAVRTGHTDTIRCIVRLADGTFVSGSSDRTLRFWDVEAARPLGRSQGHVARVLALATTASAGSLVSFGEEGAVKVWNPVPATGRDLLIGPHGDRVLVLAFAADGTHLASAAVDGTVCAWETGTGRLVSALPPRERHVLRMEFTDREDELLVLERAPVAHTLSLSDGSIRERHAIGRSLELVAPLAAGGWVSLHSGGELHHSRSDWTQRRSVATVSGRVWAIAALGAARVAVTCGEVVRLWDLETGAELAVHALPGDESLCVSASPDEALIACGFRSGVVHVLRTDDLGLVAAIDAHADQISAVRFAPDGSRLATAARDGRIRLWNPTDWREVVTLDRREGIVWALAWSPDGALLASSHGRWGTQARIALWRAPRDRVR